MVRDFSISGLVGMIAAVIAWAIAIVVIGRDQIFLVQGREIEWGTIIGALTALTVIGVLISMHKIVEPVLTALAAAAGCALLYNTRDFPFVVDGKSLNNVQNGYWPVVAALILIFLLLVISLRVTRTNNSRY